MSIELINLREIYIQYGTTSAIEWGVKIWKHKPDYFDIHSRNKDINYRWECLSCPEKMYMIIFDNSGSTIIKLSEIKSRIINIKNYTYKYDVSVEMHIYTKLCRLSNQKPYVFDNYDFTLSSITFPWEKIITK